MNNFVDALTKANNGYLFNCFDIQNFTLPLECSVQNNYWCAQAIQMSLNQAEKEIKFLQLVQAKSPVLLSRRASYFNVKIAPPSMLLAAFSLVPSSGKAIEQTSQTKLEEPNEFEKDRLEFKMTRGETQESIRIKLMMLFDF